MPRISSTTYLIFHGGLGQILQKYIKDNCQLILVTGGSFGTWRVMKLFYGEFDISMSTSPELASFDVLFEDLSYPASS